jgi:hypothetical protein
MKANHLSLESAASNKARSGILGFDKMTSGGLPRGRTSTCCSNPSARSPTASC